MFDNHFEVFLADTEESRNIHYNIRYQVYCEEMGFENKDDFPTEMEFDEDDAKSVHFIVRNKVTEDWIGAMRLIYKRDGKLPIEKSCQLDEDFKNNDLFESVEISRLCLLKEARKGNPPQGEVESISEISASDGDIPTQQNLNRLIIWGLFYAASEYGYKNNINFYYFITTTILAKLMRRGGLCLTSFGEPCEHRGKRFPFKIDAYKTFKSKIWSSGFSSYRLFSELKVASAA